MLIRCPECQFERDIDTAKIPATATVATCPRCNNRFRFREPEKGEALIPQDPSAPAEPPQADAADAPDETPASVPSVPLRRLPTEQEGDDPLPSGAIIPDLVELFSGTALTGSSGSKETEVREETIPPAEKPGRGREKTASPVAKSWFPFGKKAGQESEPPVAATRSRPSLPPEKKEEARELARKPDLDKNDSDKGGSGPLPEIRMSGGGREDGESSPLDWRDEDRFLVPWEHPDVFGMFGSLYHTILRALFRPQDLFRAVGRDFPIFRAVLFFVMLKSFHALITNLWMIGPLRQVSEEAGGAEAEVLSRAILEGISMPLMVLLVPFSLLAELFLFSFFFFIMLRLANPEKADYNIVVRVMAYSASPFVLCVVPFLGSYVGSALSWILCFIGCRFALNLSWGRTFLALAPLYLIGLAVLARVQYVLLSMI